MTSLSVSLWKTVQHHQDYLSQWLMKVITQHNTKTSRKTDGVWRILWCQREREALATNFLRQLYATSEWRWFWHANKIYGITAFMLNQLYPNLPVFLEDNFLIMEHKVSFASYPSSGLTHWGRVTHICVGNLTIIGPDNGLSPGRPQAIVWTNAGIFLIGPWGTNFSEILIGI